MRTYHVAWWNLENLFDEENAVALGRRTDKVFRAIKNDIAGWTPQLRDRKIEQLVIRLELSDPLKPLARTRALVGTLRLRVRVRRIGELRPTRVVLGALASRGCRASRRREPAARATPTHRRPAVMV
jgi:hypothetical protein